jgi:transposase-like protein
MVHTTIMRWVRRYAPEFERRWNQFARPAGASWRIDEVHGAAPDIRMQHRSFERNPA